MSWLTYRDNVKKTPAITRAVSLLDHYFEGESSEITSGWRAPMDQVRIIQEKAKRHGIHTEFPEFMAMSMREPEIMELIDGKPLYWWQRTWSKLLSIGDIVNPPIPAEVLFDYVRPGSSENKKGTTIGISPHQRGLAFDVGGGTNLTEKAKRVMRAKQEGNCFLVNFLVEHTNNAVHCDIQQIG